MKRHPVFSVVFTLFLLSVGISHLHAEWAEDGVGVCREVLAQIDCAAASDGSGGSIIVWQDERAGAHYKLFAQRLDACGDPLWTHDGIAVCSAINYQVAPQIVSDGSGGAIIVWQDTRIGSFYDIYAQRIDADGSHLWTSAGIAVCIATYHQDMPIIVSDGSGGAIIAWRDIRNGIDHDIFAQRVNASGVVQWTIDGVAISAASDNQMYAQMAPDGSGGAIITWNDTRSGYFDIYAQRVDASGTVQWTTDGVSVCTATDYQYYPQIIPAASGGAIIAWDDYRSGTGSDIYAQKIDLNGSIQWTPVDGISICNASEDQNIPRLIPISTGGAIIAWSDRRSVSDHDIYAQRIDANGNYQWTYGGIPICTESNHQYTLAAVPDGNDCAILIWKDYRSTTNYDLYAQKLSPYGELLWTATGVAISTAAGNQLDAATVTDGEGGVIVAWEDDRSGEYEDIFAQRIDNDGYWGCPAPGIMSVRDVPQDQGGFVNIAWKASQYDPPGQITEYTIWRALDISQAAMMIAGDVCVLTSPSDIHPAADGPVIRVEMLNGEPFYWEMIDSHEAYFIDTYSKIVQTAFDSTAASNEYHYFQIIAHSAVPSIFWVSDPDSGYSADNLAPCPPAALAGEQMYGPAGLQLTWDRNAEPDMDCYHVYRGLSEDFTPGPGNLLASECDTMCFDDAWKWDDGYFYKVSAIDIHGNESPYALLLPNEITGDETPDVRFAYFLGQNTPNPFNPMTKIKYGLEEPGNVRLRIYDAAGRLVRILVNEHHGTGTYEAVWDGQNHSGIPAASGVYFYELHAGRFDETKKMILLR